MIVVLSPGDTKVYPTLMPPSEGGICILSGGPKLFPLSLEARATDWKDPNLPFLSESKEIFPSHLIVLWPLFRTDGVPRSLSSFFRFHASLTSGVRKRFDRIYLQVLSAPFRYRTNHALLTHIPTHTHQYTLSPTHTKHTHTHTHTYKRP